MGSSCTVCRTSSRCRAPWKFVFLDPNRFTTNMSDNKLSHLTEGHQGMSQKSFACRMVNKFQKHEHKEGFPHKVSCGSLLGGLHASEALQPYSWIRPVSYCFIASPAIWNMWWLQEPQQSTTQKVGCHLYYQKSASTFILPGVNGIPSQLTHCSSPVQLSRRWWSKELTGFTSSH